MSDNGYKPARLFVSAKQRGFAPTIRHTPDLPAIDWSSVGQVAPTLVGSSPSVLPTADVVVITWADAEWAAMQHVFCASEKAMSYTIRSTGSWSGWTKYATGLPENPPSGWEFWGEWRLVEIGGRSVMLWKSNTHLDFPGESYLVEMTQMLLREVKPGLLLSIGTAGGAQVGDHVGTVRAVSAGTLYESGRATGYWPVYSNAWTPTDTVFDDARVDGLLVPVPTAASDLQALCTAFNAYYGTSYSLAELDPNGLNSGDALPKITDQTGGAESLLTTPTFVVGTTAGTYAGYACIEMDDAVIGQVCSAAGVAFGFVRNVSDPVQSAALPTKIQGSWGSTIYDAYGIYTSYNGAIAAWAMLAEVM